MKRSFQLFIGIVILGVVAQPADAQNVYFNAGIDSVLALRPGSSRTVELDLYAAGNGISTYSVTLRFDPAVVHVLGATGTPGYMPDPTVTPGSGQVTIAATGSVPNYFSVIPLANVTFSVDAAATAGVLVQIDVNQMIGYFGGDFLSTTAGNVFNVCTASTTWGDIDANGAINTRDALIALSSAVGLPTGGFNVSSGDVDNDGAITSRDALFILSIGIGLPPAGRAGNGVADKCAPLLAAPADLAVTTATGTDLVSAGDTVRTTIPLAVPRELGTPIRWSPVSSLLAYECQIAPGNSDICVVDGNGVLSPGHLNVGAGARAAYPAWSPDGSQLAYIQDYGVYGNIYIVDANGANNHLVFPGYGATSLAWSQDGTRLLFTYCCNYLYTVNVDGSNLAELFPTSYVNGPNDAAWSPAGDSVAYAGSGYGFVYKTNGTDAGLPAIKLGQGAKYPSWITAGLAFQQSSPFGIGDVWLQQASDQRFYRLTHGTGSLGDQWLDLKRAPGVWIFSIAVTPTTPTVSVTGSTSSATQPMTATVTNSNSTTNTTAPVTWSSADPAIASVDAAGLVTAVSPGLVYVRATVGGWRTDSTQVTVQP
jgi:hypothetical protein